MSKSTWYFSRFEKYLVLRGGQGAIEYVIILATLSLLVVFSGDFLTRVRNTLDDAFVAAVGKMVPP